MSRAIVTILGDLSRGHARKLLERVPLGTRVEFKGSRRSLPQNDKMWAMLTEVARQKEHYGRKYSAEVWKCLFLHQLFEESLHQLIPSLDESEIIKVTRSSRNLSKNEMSELIELIAAWGAQNGVRFANDEQA